MKQRLAWALILGVVGVAFGGCDDDGPASPRDAGDASADSVGDGPVTDAPRLETGNNTDAIGGGGDGGGDTIAPNPTGTVGAPGGRLVSADGRLIVTIPRGALSYPVEVSIKPAMPTPPGALGAVYQIEPIGLRLLRPASVVLRYQAAELAGGMEDDSRLGQYRNGQWSELAKSLPDTRADLVTGDLTQLGVVALLPGLCRICTMTCTPGSCKFGQDPATGMGGVDGKCVEYGKGCQRCVPVCDTDGDGYCPGPTVMDQPGGDCGEGDPTVNPAPETKEICGNGVDDDCNFAVDDGCTPCDKQSDCTLGNQACFDGVCAVCENACVEAACLFGDEPNPVRGRCHALGSGGCKVCVPSCDADGDGYCPQADPGNKQPGGDCVDDNPLISPKATEICGNGADDDCNGFVDDMCSGCDNDGDCPADGLSCRKGSCQGCVKECEVGGAACNISAQANAPTGKCVVSGKGCTKCVPTCDVDGDGYCSAITELGPGGDCNDTPAGRDIFPNAIEVCGNGDDDDCDNQIDEGCDPCESDTDCQQGSQTCQEGFCEVCTAACDAANCRFGAVMMEGMPPVPGVAGRCHTFGQGCSKCVPNCDSDGDGVCPQANPGSEQPGGDCNDADGKVSPLAPEVCGNAKDDDCDGRIDEACAACSTAMVCNANESCTTTK